MAGAVAGIDTTEAATLIIEAASAVGAALSLYANAQMIGIARDYYNLYKEQREFYYNTFQQGVEKPLTLEVFSVLPYQYNYTNPGLDQNTGIIGRPTTSIGEWWDRHANMYHDARDECITELELDNARLESDWTNYFFRFEEHNFDIINDRRWNRRFEVHNLGIKQANFVQSGLASGFAQVEDSINDAADQFNSLANGGMAAIGYRKGLSDAADDFTSYGYKSHGGNMSKSNSYGGSSMYMYDSKTNPYFADVA